MSCQTTSVIFSCARQSNKISSEIGALSGNLFDFVVFAGVDNTKIQAHRTVLSTSNDFFQAMFRSNLREANTNEVGFKYIDGSIMKSIITFIYTASIDINIETVQSLLEAARFLQMNTLVTACSEFIEERLDISNCLATVLLADHYNYTYLCTASYSFAWRYFDEVCVEKEFFQLNEEQLKKLLSSDYLITSSEEKVFQSILAWVQYDTENRNKLFPEVLSNVRFASLDPKFIVENRHSVAQSIECYQMICYWLQWHLSPESRSNYPTELTRPRRALINTTELVTYCDSSYSEEHSFDQDYNDDEFSPQYDEEFPDHNFIEPAEYYESDESSDDYINECCNEFFEENDEMIDDNFSEPDEYCESDVSCESDGYCESDECIDNSDYEHPEENNEVIDDNFIEPNEYSESNECIDNCGFELPGENDEMIDDNFIEPDEYCEPDEYIADCNYEHPEEGHAYDADCYEENAYDCSDELPDDHIDDGFDDQYYVDQDYNDDCYSDHYYD